MANQACTICWNASVVMPAWVAPTSSAMSFSPSPARAEASLSAIALNTGRDFSDGSLAASSRARSMANTPSKYIGCSHHRVPSLSKVAMRSSGGTKAGPGVVARSTKPSIARRAGPSAQETRPLPPGGAGADWA